jgi:hypothetical protein
VIETGTVQTDTALAAEQGIISTTDLVKVYRRRTSGRSTS